MNVRQKTLLLLAGAALLLAVGVAGVSCTKGPGFFRPGRSIRFVASMGAGGTRTIYSGEGTTGTDGLLTRERIDWKDGDLIRIYSPQAAQSNGSTHYADYAVQSHETVGTPGAELTSRATVAVATGSSDLCWADDSEHAFFALYPSPATDGFTPGHTLEQDGVVFAPEAAGQDEVMTFTGVIPAEQTVTRRNATGYVWLPDMRPAYMLATASSTQEAASDSGINLQFVPKFSAFEFTVSAGEFYSVTLSSFTLTCTTGYLTGSYRISQEDFGVTTEGIADANVTDGGRSITLNFGPSGLTFTNTAPLTFTVLALPQEVSGLTITFTGDVIGTRSLELKMADGSPISWAPYKKHHIYGLRFPTLLDVIVVDQINWEGIYYSDGSVIGDPLLWPAISTDHPVDGHLDDELNWGPGDGSSSPFDGLHLGRGYLGDNLTWLTEGGIGGPFAGLYLSRGYLTNTADGYALSGNDPLEILRYYGNEDVATTPRHYLRFSDLGITSVPGFSVPTQAQWESIIGTTRVGAQVNGVPGRHYAKVTVSLSGTEYASYSSIPGLLLFPDGAVLECQELEWAVVNTTNGDLEHHSAYDTPDAAFTPTISIIYDRLLELCSYGCAFLPCVGKNSGSGWELGGAEGLYWSTTASTGLGITGGTVSVTTGLTDTDYFPVRMIKVWE